MLTRLKVSGFKNLVDVDIHFGPFTCIAGANGVGKSNLLDAILFLSALADGPLLDAALSVRDQGGKTGDIRGLFHHAGDRFDEEMTFLAEMIIPEEGWDDLGQHAKASSTFVQYEVSLCYRGAESGRAMGSLELVREELTHITLGEAAKHLPFENTRAWRNRVIKNARRTRHYISSEGSGPNRVINVHQDGGSSGKPQKILAPKLPRTVLSAANSAESPTATLVRREMQSWRLLQLEPSALRAPDNFTAPIELASNGAHLPATLYHLANTSLRGPESVYAEVANRVSELIDDVRSVEVDHDERRELLTLYARGADGTPHPARALSDGTLRFLALAILTLDPESRGLICMEEPENGIHPERIPAMIRLLSDLAAEVNPAEEPPDVPGSLRQVIFNTHSPAVVMQVPDDCLVVAENVESERAGSTFKTLRLRCLPGTWRATAIGQEQISKGRLLSYLNPVPQADPEAPGHLDLGAGFTGGRRAKRVADREDLRQYKLDLAG